MLLICFRPISYEARRVVVTGLGSMTCLGCDVATNWAGLLAGRSGIRDVRERMPEGEEDDVDLYGSLTSRVAGRIDPTEYGLKRDEAVPSKADQRSMTRSNIISLIVTQEALQVIAQFQPANWT